jgi:predicted transcriptional regulator
MLKWHSLVLAALVIVQRAWLLKKRINEQVVLQDQEGVLAWVSERLAVAMRQA